MKKITNFTTARLAAAGIKKPLMSRLEELRHSGAAKHRIADNKTPHIKK